MHNILMLVSEGSLDVLVDAAARNWTWTVGGAIAIVAIVSCGIRCTIRSCSRERTRREVAAYIAEGSMTPAQGERLMEAGNDEA